LPEGSEAGPADCPREITRGRSPDDGDGAGEDGADGGADGRGPREPLDLYRLCYELAGIIGVHPAAWTLRGLIWSATAKQKEKWGHTSSLIAQHYSIHRDPKKRSKPYQPSEFNPFIEPPKPKILTEADLSEIFGD
jgi:hypothetical protein